MKYKLLVLDLDGTLTNSKKEITPRTLEVLKRVQECGVKLVLASGRPTYGVVPLAKELGMDLFGGYIVSFNGGTILDAQSLEVLFEQTLPHSLVPHLYRAAISADTQIMTYRNEYILTETPENKYVQHEAFLTKMTPLKVEDFCLAIEGNPNKCLIVGDPELLPPLEAKLNEQYSELLFAGRSEPFYLEVVPQGVDKAKSLGRLLEIIGSSPSEMIAIGDGFNDLSMIQFAGLGVAMANAQQVVKEAADYVTPLTNDQDGVAHFAEEMILRKL